MSRECSVRMQPWDGDLPVAWFTLGDVQLMFNGRLRGRQWTLHTDLVQTEPSRGRPPPTWAFLMSNGAEELFVTRENGKDVIQMTTKRSMSMFEVALKRDEGAELRAMLEEEALDTGCTFGKAVAKDPVVPLGYAAKFLATRRVLSAKLGRGGMLTPSKAKVDAEGVRRVKTQIPRFGKNVGGL